MGFLFYEFIGEGDLHGQDAEFIIDFAIIGILCGR